MNLSRVNLNLLVALNVLLEERHVTRAGDRLGITQSAMSNILKQLREVFQDELFVRGAASKMVPTARALELAGPVREALAKAEMVFTKPEPFVPERAKRTFTLGMSDYAEFVLLPSLIQQLRQVAPHIDIIVKHVNFLADEHLLETSVIDLAIGIYVEIPPVLMTEELFTDRSICVGWRENPLMQHPMDLRELAKAEHVITLFFEDRSTLISEKLIKQAGLERRAVVTVPHALSALFLLPKTHLVALVLERVAKTLMKSLNLICQPAPFENPVATSLQIWHPKTNQDPALQWLRNLVKEVAKRL